MSKVACFACRENNKVGRHLFNDTLSDGSNLAGRIYAISKLKIEKDEKLRYVCSKCDSSLKTSYSMISKLNKLNLSTGELTEEEKDFIILPNTSTSASGMKTQKRASETMAVKVTDNQQNKETTMNRKKMKYDEVKLEDKTYQQMENEIEKQLRDKKTEAKIVLGNKANLRKQTQISMFNTAILKSPIYDEPMLEEEKPEIPENENKMERLLRILSEDAIAAFIKNKPTIANFKTAFTDKIRTEFLKAQLIVLLAPGKVQLQEDVINDFHKFLNTHIAIKETTE